MIFDLLTYFYYWRRSYWTAKSCGPC